MNFRELANPECPKCQGTGVIKGQKLSERWRCPCVIVAQRLQAADRVLDSVLPPRARAMTLDNFQTGGLAQNEQALNVSENFVNAWEKFSGVGGSLGFYGQPRTGKTHLAVGIAQGCTRRFGIKPQLLNLPKALRVERGRFDRDDSVPSLFQQAETVDLLILDDFGAEYDRAADDNSRVSWLTELLYVLLDARLMGKRPTIYTSNLAPSDMERRYSDNEAWQRVYARLTEGEFCDPLEVLKVPGMQIADPGAKALLFAGL